MTDIDWQPCWLLQVFKLIFGGTMGLIACPIIALCALLAMGRQDLASRTPVASVKQDGLDGNHAAHNGANVTISPSV